MNDKCAAGTGRFLEIMGTALGYRPQEFARAALAAEKAVSVNSMCTVFAESEVISLTARGVSRKEIALGLHQSIVRRAAGLLRRIEIKPDIVFAGGVAYNECIRKLLEQQLGMQVLVPEDPQIIGALGAALEAERRNTTS
jgi:predicted CoA-substrate-specific enzyme activase